MMAKTATPRLSANSNPRGEARRAASALALAATLFLPAVARGELYQWTDASGGVVISDRPPVEISRVRDLKVLGQTRSRIAASPDVDEPRRTREQVLEARIAELEAQLQEQQYAPPPEAMPPENAAVDASLPPYAPPPESAPVVYSSGFRPTPYFVAPPVLSAVVVRSLRPHFRREPPRPPVVRLPPQARPAPPMVRPAPRHTTGVPQFLGKTPQFVGPTPHFIPGVAPPSTVPPPHVTQRPATPNRLAAGPQRPHGRHAR